MIQQGFVGPSNRARALNFDAEYTYNLYLERSGAGVPASDAMLLNRPGLTPYIGLPAGNIRCLFAQDGRAFAVGGAVFAELLNNQTALLRGTVAVDSRPATICSNGNGGRQLMIVSGGLGYIFDLDDNTLTQIADDTFPAYAVMGEFFDGYFIVLDNGGTFYLSSLEDGEEWNGLDTGQESQASDQTIALFRNHDQLWLGGSVTMAPWYNSGNASFPLQPVPGSLIQHGMAAPFSFAKADNTIFWLGADPLGAGQVYRADGFTPKHISTPAVETYLTRVKERGGRLDDAIGWACQMDSHLFYLLYLPSAPTTLVYDVSTDNWVEWTRWNPKTLRHEPFRGRCHAYAFGRHLVGDRSSGTIYRMDLNVYTDSIIPVGA